METIVSETPVTGEGTTVKKKVNVRALPSIYSTRVTTISSAGTLVTIMAEVINSSGEKWYAVKLLNGIMGYIRADLLYAQVFPVEEVAEAAEVVAAAAEPQIVYVYVTPEPVTEVTPQVIYVKKESPATPTPQIIYIDGDPEPTPAPDRQPEVG